MLTVKNAYSLRWVFVGLFFVGLKVSMGSMVLYCCGHVVMCVEVGSTHMIGVLVPCWTELVSCFALIA